MSGFVCPNCGQQIDIFTSGGGEDMSRQLGIDFLGRIPLDPQIVQACDTGQLYVGMSNRHKTTNAFSQVTQSVLTLENHCTAEQMNSNEKGAKSMRIAIPVVEGKLSQHFGHSDTFAIVDTDGDSRQVLNRKDLTPPRHEPGVLPKWLHSEGVNVIIAGGMGQRAQQLFAQSQIEVVVGAPAETPENLVSAYLDSTLQTGDNLCDH
jgi:predicted Fe-Mo cluster-binding NifX family protein